MKSIRLASILMTAGWLNAGTIYTITDLGSLGGGTAQAFGLNANGLSVGSATTPFGYEHAFSNSGSGITDLTVNTNASEGTAAGVNNGGTIIGTQYINGQAYATEWSNGSAQVVINGPGGAGSYGMAINNSGQIAGMMTTDGQGNAFVTINGVVVDLGTLAGGDWSSAYAINNSGGVAGYGNTGSGAFRGFVWSQATGFTELGTLGGASSYAMAINDQGQVAGDAQTASGYLNAFLWINGTMQDLGTLGGNNSYAYGVNDSGIVVGYSDVDGSGDPHAFIFENGVMLDLNSLIDPSSGWILTEAYAINGSGEIVGEGLLDGVEHAFLLDPISGTQSAGVASDPASDSTASDAATPEPAPWTLLAIGLIAVVSSRLRLRFPFPLPLPRLPRDPRQAHSQSDVSLR